MSQIIIKIQYTVLLPVDAFSKLKTFIFSLSLRFFFTVSGGMRERDREWGNLSTRPLDFLFFQSQEEGFPQISCVFSIQYLYSISPWTLPPPGNHVCTVAICYEEMFNFFNLATQIPEFNVLNHAAYRYIATHTILKEGFERPWKIIAISQQGQQREFLNI